MLALKERIKHDILVLDGAMGTMLQQLGLQLGECPDTYSITHPEMIAKVHRGYLESGSNIIYTNTFGANAKKLADTPYSVSEVITAAVSIAKKEAAAFGAYVALDVGPIGELIEPMGPLEFEEAYRLFAEQVCAGAAAGADLVVIETMTDLYECKAALLAAKENCNLPVLCTMSFEQNMRTFTGCDYRAMALTLEALGADAIGINCSLGPLEILPIARELVQYTTLPVVVKPNAGLPSPDNTMYAIAPGQFAQTLAECIGFGVTIVGGCCGTDTTYISAIKQAVAAMIPVKRDIPRRYAVCSGSRMVELDRVRVIGERINPTGKKMFQQALKDRNIDYILRQAIEQAEAGAEILDVNVGIPDVNEPEMLVAVVKAIQSVTDLPLQIDSSDPAAIEAALRAYNGKAIVNSVNGDEAVLANILPVVKKYGAAVVGLTLDENGIPDTAAERVEIAKRIIARAVQIGIAREDVYIDCLALTVSAQQENAMQTLQAIKTVSEELGVKTVLGVSNISFGLPERELVNRTFLTMALHNGLSLPIINPNLRSMMDVVYASEVLLGIDQNSERYVERYAALKLPPASTPAAVSAQEMSISYYIKKGLKEKCREQARKLLETLPPLEVVSGHLIPALDEVGREYEEGSLFLPQLIQAAETAKVAFELVNQAMPKGQRRKDMPVVLCTVKGDIHDIGKNIVKVVLENYGYRIIDLGRDVAPEAVVRAAKESGAKLVGLSALMTTTIRSMEETIAALKREAVDCKICVGGAVLTKEYADKMGADYYAKDANEAVAVAKTVYGQ